MAEPARYPQYLPYPSAIKRWMGPESVPNAASINWPQAQFAPRYLAPGSPSVSPYRYEAGGPLSRFTPSMYSSEVSDLGPSRTPVPVQDAPALVPEDESGPELGCLGCGPSCSCASCQAKHNPAASDIMQTLAVLSAPVAMAVSYSRNKSILWALASGLVGPAYLTYVAYEKITAKK